MDKATLGTIEVLNVPDTALAHEWWVVTPFNGIIWFETAWDDKNDALCRTEYLGSNLNAFLVRNEVRA